MKYKVKEINTGCNVRYACTYKNIVLVLWFDNGDYLDRLDYSAKVKYNHSDKSDKLREYQNIKSTFYIDYRITKHRRLKSENLPPFGFDCLSVVDNRQMTKTNISESVSDHLKSIVLQQINKIIRSSEEAEFYKEKIKKRAILCRKLEFRFSSKKKNAHDTKVPF